MISSKKKLLLSAIGSATLMGSAVPTYAANWLMLQGTEKPGQAARARVWGFIQPEYSYTKDTELKAGPWAGASSSNNSAIFNQQRPDRNSPDGFNVLRARLGVRGTGFPLDSNVNYFLLAEFGNNGITRPSGGSVKLTDASVTLNHIKGARFRVGQFKTPGSEEGLQAIHVFDYINFTTGVDGLLLERFFDYDGSGTTVTGPPASVPPDVQNSGRVNGLNGSVGAFRDIGIQVFDTFKQGDWEHSYAGMIGNGNGIARADNDDNYETYLYWSSERLYGGKGARRQGWKLYGWYQDGKRTLINENKTGILTDDFEAEYDRERWGFGTTFRKGKWRAAAEYIDADGMIFNGTDGAAVPGATAGVGPGGVFGTALASFNIEPEGEADSWYIHGGYAITPKWEVDLRYDQYNRMTDVSNKERQFETWTAGVQYFFNKKSRFLVNYEFRDAEAPNQPGNSNANQILDGLDDRITAQLLVIF